MLNKNRGDNLVLHAHTFLCTIESHFWNGSYGLLGQVEPLLRAVRVSAFVLLLHRVVVHDLDAVPGVHAEAEQLQRAANVVAAVGQVGGALDGRLDHA